MGICSAYHHAVVMGNISFNPVSIDFIADDSYKAEQLSGITRPSPTANFTPIGLLMWNVRPEMQCKLPLNIAVTKPIFTKITA